ncbi:MRN complex-interacting protein-like [Saccostrea cucullata]|uniref:MRN complex-interacting protein-like n=1 Tax=Saccostrea cuccullata TaxID=36930 RepID=UPI002ED13167
MPQEFHVLQCYSCSTFQVHQVKKSSNKWNCKLCGEKQSIKKVFGRGSGADCRQHVQRLNTLRQQQEVAVVDSAYQDVAVAVSAYQDVAVVDSSYQGFSGDKGPDSEELTQSQDIPQHNSGSKWSQYVEEAHEDSTAEYPQPEEELYTTDGNQFYCPKKRKRDYGKSCSYNNKRQIYQRDDADFSSKRTWKGQKENLQYGYDTDYSTCNTQPNHNFSQPKSYTSDPNNYGPNGTKSSLQNTANCNEGSLFSIANRDNVAGFEGFETLKTINQNQISACATNSEPKPQNTPKTKSSSLSSNRGSKGSKWDQFLAEGSDEDSEDTEETSVESSQVVQSLIKEPARLHSKVQETGSVIMSSNCEYYKSVTVTGSEIGMFSVGDLEDSDFDV